MKFLWFPLSLAIFGAYAIQHGLTTLGKTNLVPTWTMEGLSIFYIVLAIGTFFMGPILDNVNSRKALLFGVALGIIGIYGLNIGPWFFGIFFGLASAIIKIIPFSGPLKLINKNEALNISPQAAAKNIGSLFFLLFFSGVLIQYGWGYSVTILAILFGMSGLLTYYMMPDDKIEGWKWSIFLKLAKQLKFWLIMLMLGGMSAGYYWCIPQFIPAIKNSGFTTQEAVWIQAGLLLIAVIFRFINAWIGQKIGHWKYILIGTILQPMTVLFVLPYNPILATALFQPIGAIPTPNYWAGYKQEWGPEYIATTSALGFVFMYLCTGLVLGKWVM